MKGRTPKPPALRQNRSKASTRAILDSKEKSAKREVPPLPEREKKAEVWHPAVLEWWESVWTSPMAGEFLGPDMLGGLYTLAELYQQRWTCDSRKELVAIAAEIRLQEIRFGLSPIDRRRLQWEVERGDQAVEKTKQRRRARKARKNVKKDPREVLKVV